MMQKCRLELSGRDEITFVEVRCINRDAGTDSLIQRAGLFRQRGRVNGILMDVVCLWRSRRLGWRWDLGLRFCWAPQRSPANRQSASLRQAGLGACQAPASRSQAFYINQDGHNTRTYVLPFYGGFAPGTVIYDSRNDRRRGKLFQDYIDGAPTPSVS